MVRYSIEIDRGDLTQQRQVPNNPQAEPGEIIVRVDLVALTSNNVTYAVHGGAPLHYWDFFPASDAAHGIVPVWGYGTVIESQADGIATGLRLYGYWPSATHAVLRPGPPRAGGFTDQSPHRQALAPAYNFYRPTPSVPASAEALFALFQPLYGTGYVLAASLAADMEAGHEILLTSASSKTALATAFSLQQAGHAPTGLTSAANKAFVERSGYYGRVLAYEELEKLESAAPTVLVDFAGNGALKARLHTHLKGLTASHIVGDTNWNSAGDSQSGQLPGPQPALFFAPTHWAGQSRKLGAQAFESALAQSLAAFLATTSGWLTVTEMTGPAGFTERFNQLLANRVPPDAGLIWRP